MIVVAGAGWVDGEAGQDGLFERHFEELDIVGVLVVAGLDQVDASFGELADFAEGRGERVNELGGFP